MKTQYNLTASDQPVYRAKVKTIKIVREYGMDRGPGVFVGDSAIHLSSRVCLFHKAVPQILSKRDNPSQALKNSYTRNSNPGAG